MPLSWILSWNVRSGSRPYFFAWLLLWLGIGILSSEDSVWFFSYVSSSTPWSCVGASGTCALTWNLTRTSVSWRYISVETWYVRWLLQMLVERSTQYAPTDAMATRRPFYEVPFHVGPFPFPSPFSFTTCQIFFYRTLVLACRRLILPVAKSSRWKESKKVGKKTSTQQPRSKRTLTHRSRQQFSIRLSLFVAQVKLVLSPFLTINYNRISISCLSLSLSLILRPQK